MKNKSSNKYKRGGEETVISSNGINFLAVHTTTPNKTHKTSRY